MSNIRNQSAPVNGDATVSDKKFRLLDRLHGDLRLSRADVCVAHFIINWFNPAKGYAWPSMQRLAEVTGLSLRTVKYAVARLVRFGLIKIKNRGRRGRGHASEYVPNWEYGVSPDAERNGASACTISEMVQTHVGNGAKVRQEMVQALAPHTTTTPVVTTKGVVVTGAGRSPADAGRPRAGEVAPKKAAPKNDAPGSLFERLWALPWIDKSFKARNAAKRAVDKTKARADAPPDDLLVAKAESYLANVPRAEQRWLSVWLRDEGWLCDESPPKPDRAPKANGKAAPQGSLASRYPVGTRVRWPQDGSLGRVVEHRTEQNWDALAEGEVPAEGWYGVDEPEPVRILWDDGNDGWHGQGSLKNYEVVVGDGEAVPDDYDPDRETGQQYAVRRGFAVGVKVRQDNEGVDEEGWVDENELGEVISMDGGHDYFWMEVKWPSKQDAFPYDAYGMACLQVVP